MRIFCLFFIICYTVTSCVYHKDAFTAKPVKTRMETGKSFEMDGSYYTIDSVRKTLSVLFFYGNGIQRLTAFDSNHYNRKDIAGSINNMVVKFHKAGRSKHLYFRDGGFEVDGSEIIVQGISYIPQAAWGIVTLKGSVTSDTTIVFTSSRIHNTEQTSNPDSSLYRFLRTSKPDSLAGNKWKNKKWFWNY